MNIHRATSATFTSIEEEFGYTKDEIVGKYRGKHISSARQTTIYILRQLGLSYPEIAGIVNRDHQAVRYSVLRVLEDGELKRKGDLIYRVVTEQITKGDSGGKSGE